MNRNTEHNDHRWQPTTPAQRYRRRREREKDLDPRVWLQPADDDDSTDQADDVVKE